LFQNVDFRPELRNGLTMILMYTFAASQAARAVDGSDLFGVVMDSTHGLGIFHKTSLRVYSDPFNFFNFLKMCLTGLIECGVLRENERVSQAVPKTRRRHFEVESELVAFNDLKALLIRRLDDGDLGRVKSCVSEVVACWQDKSLKIGRSRRFAVALQTLSRNSALHAAQSLFPQLTHALSVETGSSSAGMVVAGGPASLEMRQSKRVRVGGSMNASASQGAQSGSGAAASVSSPAEKTAGRERRAASEAASMSLPVPVPAAAPATAAFGVGVGVTSDIPVPAVCVLRCDRVGVDSWEVHHTQINDVAAFFENPDVKRVFAVDATCLSAEELAQRRLAVRSKGLLSLESELRFRGAVQTTWSRSELPQLRGFMDTCRSLAWTVASQRYRTNGAEEVAPSAAIRNAQKALPFCCDYRLCGETPECGKCVCLVYERVIQSGYLLRAAPELGVPADTWRMVYGKDLEQYAVSPADPAATGSFAEFLANLFPQLRTGLLGLPSLDGVTVSYSPQFGSTSCTSVTALVKSGLDANACPSQNLGTLSSGSNDILSR
jgi:hypothetical protein